MADEKPFTAKDAKDLAGLSYRQLNDWESRDAIPGDRTRERSWRRFSPKEIFALMVCGEIRRLYGIPVEKLRFVKNLMMKEGPNHFAAAIQMMHHGLHVFLLTDLEETFLMDSDLELNLLMRYGYFREEKTRPYIFLRLNEIVNRLLSMTKEPIELRPHDALYRLQVEQWAAITVQTHPELDLLQAVRSGEFDRIEVKVQDGLIHFLGTEGDVAPEDLKSVGDAVRVRRKKQFETLRVKSQDGQIVSARRTLPRKYTKADNEPMLFVDVVKKRRAKKSRK